MKSTREGLEHQLLEGVNFTDAGSLCYAKINKILNVLEHRTEAE